jgi:hypothetical protein
MYSYIQEFQAAEDFIFYTRLYDAEVCINLRYHKFISEGVKLYIIYSDYFQGKQFLRKRIIAQHAALCRLKNTFLPCR